MRHTPIDGVVLTNADVDHVTGLLSMREAQPFAIYGTSRVLAALKANAIFNILATDLVSWRPLRPDHAVEILGPDGRSGGLRVKAFPIPGKIALWLEDPRLAEFGTIAEDTVGLEISSSSARTSFFYIPGCATLPAETADCLRGADLVFFDGTTYTDNEMIAAGLGSKTASRMGHMSVSGPGGTIASFATLDVARKIFIHINNSNPILIAGSPERRAVEAAGWEIAQDGLEVRL